MVNVCDVHSGWCAISSRDLLCLRWIAEPIIGEINAELLDLDTKVRAVFDV